MSEILADWRPSSNATSNRCGHTDHTATMQHHGRPCWCAPVHSRQWSASCPSQTLFDGERPFLGGHVVFPWQKATATHARSARLQPTHHDSSIFEVPGCEPMIRQHSVLHKQQCPEHVAGEHVAHISHATTIATDDVMMRHGTRDAESAQCCKHGIQFSIQ